jgi:glutamyl-tRNA synthetase
MCTFIHAHAHDTQPEELAEKFSLERITKSAAVFDKVKLSWMNGQHIKMLPEEEVRVYVSVCACGCA